MKKLFLILALSALFLIVSCGDGSKKSDNADSGETVTDEDGDTADEEPADAEPADTGQAEESDKDGGDSTDDSGDSKPDEDPTPEPTEADQCVAAGGTWSWDGTEGICKKTVSCPKITVEHAEWNGEDSYIQKYAAGKWSEEVPTKYDETKGDCHFKCAANYAWNGKECMTECNMLTTDFPCYDPESKLTWSEKYASMIWEDAIEYCQKLNGSNYGGHSLGWYLPNIDELMTLLVWSKADSCKVSEKNGCLAYDECNTYASCAEAYDESDDSWNPGPKFSKFGDGDYYEAYWSASSLSDYSGYAWTLYSYYGMPYWAALSDERVFRCVWVEPDETVTTCAEKGGIWDRTQKKCEKNVPCDAKPEHTEWNGDGTDTQEYDYASQKWVGKANPKYGYEEGECHYVCASNYGWNGTDCEQFLANEIDVKPVPEDQDNTSNAACNPATFVEFCDGNAVVYCDENVVSRSSCGSEKTCMTTFGMYPSNGNKNYAWCYQSCETPGAYGKSLGCVQNPEDVVGALEFYVCFKTSKGNLFFADEELPKTTEQCTTPCDASGDECLPECSDNGVTPCSDPESGLTWSDISSSYISWTETDSSGTVTYPAKEHCEGLEEDGFDDWRLPNIDELRTLLIADRIKTNCKVSETAECLSYADCWSCSECTETATQSSESNACAIWDYSAEDIYSKLGDKKINLWSSSLLSDKPKNVWYIDFDYGAVDNLPQVNEGVYVRCVR